MEIPTESQGAGPVWQPDRPYNDLPPIPPNGDLESREVLKACIEARAALAELKQAGELIPNPSVLINTLPLLEAQASSEIENIVTTTDRLFQFREDDDHADGATKEALRYSRALLEGFRSLRDRPLTTRTAEEICTEIKGTEMRVRRVPGTALARANGDIVYTPPVGEELLRRLLANWEQFMHGDEGLDPLIRMAISHYQFEAIHPFTDGNGRTGRILNSLFFISRDLLTLPILYLSRYIIENKSDYYRLLLEVTRTSDWQEWLLFMLRGVEETSRWTVAKIGAIRRLQTETSEYVRSKKPKIYSHEFVNLIFEKPYARIQDVTDRGLAGRQTASVYLKALVEIGVLAEKSAGREKLFIHPRLMAILTRDANDWPALENDVST
jgi:Fic family protein